MVTTATTRALMVIFAPVEIAPARVAEAAAVSAERTLSCCGGTLLESSVV
jgi:DNA/RNA-binding domain of Phe-tRNA-synthetase-like protein